MLSTISKPCARCKKPKPLSDYYVRSGVENPTDPGHYNSECKECLKSRGKDKGNVHPTVPRAETEIYAIDKLKSVGIPALPGKAVHAADVDVVAFGCVWIEIKYAKLKRHRGQESFVFSSTKRQTQRGYLAHLVMLICDYEDHKTFHLFRSNHEAFYIYGRVKIGFVFTPGQVEQIKHMENRVKLVQPIMDDAQDRFDLVWRVLLEQSEALKRPSELVAQI